MKNKPPGTFCGKSVWMQALATVKPERVKWYGLENPSQIQDAARCWWISQYRRSRDVPLDTVSDTARDADPGETSQNGIPAGDSTRIALRINHTGVLITKDSFSDGVHYDVCPCKHLPTAEKMISWWLCTQIVHVYMPMWIISRISDRDL